MAQTGLDALTLDALDLEGNAIIPAFEEVLENPDVQPAQLLLFVAALPAKELALGKNNLRRIMAGLVLHKDTAVRAAAVKKQKEAEAVLAERH